jgi:hypothetical protein
MGQEGTEEMECYSLEELEPVSLNWSAMKVILEDPKYIYIYEQ